MRILSIEGQPRVADFVCRGLFSAGWSVEMAGSAGEGLALLRSASHDIVLLGGVLPGMSGEEVCRHLRSVRDDILILMLGAPGPTRAGADDYLPEPFEFDELAARIEALVRRRNRHGVGGAPALLTVGPFTFDPGSLRLTCAGEELDLSGKERDVFVMLMRNPGRVIARERLLNAVWGVDIDPMTNVVDVTISRIRRKLPDGADLIRTVRTYGYRLDL